jgi:predicted AlkP superfamily pyrophosphatase or phosphodiesterase
MRLLRFFLVLCCWPLLQAAEIPVKDRMVVLISLDGLPAYALEDPKLPAPTLRRLAQEGALAKRMTVSNPSVTWPVHTSMVTGVPAVRHSVLYNGLLVRQGPKSPPRVEPYHDKTELVRATTVYDLAHQAGLTTAQVDWVAIENAPTITWQFHEWPNPNGPIEREMIAAGILTLEEVQRFTKSNVTWRDQMWTQAAVHILKNHRPNLLLFHVLNLDSIHHRYGTRNLASYTAIAFADERVRQILEAVESAGIKDRTTLVVVSDHGFKSATRSIRPNALLRQHGLLKGQGSKIECDAHVIPEGGTAMVYVTDPANRTRLVPQLREIFRNLEGVDRVIEPAEYPPLGFPDPAVNQEMSDLVLAAKSGYAFAAAYEGDAVVNLPAGASPGSHGYLASDPDMDAILLAWGRGIRPGVTLERIQNLDVAPTVAALLGLKMRNVVGRELREVLK